MKVEPFAVNRKLVLKAIDDCLASVVSKVNEHFTGRLGTVKVALGAALLSMIVSFPLYKNWSHELNDDATIQALMVKFHNPLSPIPAKLKDQRLYDGDASHNDKLELRLTLPILGWLSRTGKWTVIIWSPLAALVVFYLLAKLGSNALGDDVGGALFALGLGPTFFGFWFFADIDIGDGIAFLFLLLSVASRNWFLAFVSFLAAAFADERCVAALPLLLLYFAVSLGKDQDKNLRRKLCASILISAGTWWILRYWVGRSFHLTMGTSLLGTLSIIRYNLTASLPYTFLNIFKATWTIPLLAVISLWLQKRWVAFFAYVGAFTVALVPAFLVADFDRSVCYTFTILLTSLYFLKGEKEASRKYLAAILVINLLLISPGSTIFRIAVW